MGTFLVIIAIALPILLPQIIADYKRKGGKNDVQTSSHDDE